MCSQMKAAEDGRSPKPGGGSTRPRKREASWTAAVLCRFHLVLVIFRPGGAFLRGRVPPIENFRPFIVWPLGVKQALLQIETLIDRQLIKLSRWIKPIARNSCGQRFSGKIGAHELAPKNFWRHFPDACRSIFARC